MIRKVFLLLLVLVVIVEFANADEEVSIEYLTKCQQGRKDALERYRRTKNYDIWIPSCANDGTYNRNQHRNGLSWCVDPQTGYTVAPRYTYDSRGKRDEGVDC